MPAEIHFNYPVQAATARSAGLAATGVGTFSETGYRLQTLPSVNQGIPSLRPLTRAGIETYLAISEIAELADTAQVIRVDYSV